MLSLLRDDSSSFLVATVCELLLEHRTDDNPDRTIKVGTVNPATKGLLA